MSATPRTDAETGYFELNKCEVNYRNEPYVKTEFARVLERELADISHAYGVTRDIVKGLCDELATLKAENAALRADKERLDWLARNRSVSATERPLSVTPESLRAAIDAARAKEAKP
jgi:hypothetical protein